MIGMLIVGYVFAIRSERRICAEGQSGLSLVLQVDIWDLERLFRSSQANTSRDEIEIDLVALTGAPLPCEEQRRLRSLPRSAARQSTLSAL
jgi:hypothetical protein